MIFVDVHNCPFRLEFNCRDITYTFVLKVYERYHIVIHIPIIKDSRYYNVNMTLNPEMIVNAEKHIYE